MGLKKPRRLKKAVPIKRSDKLIFSIEKTFKPPIPWDEIKAQWYLNNATKIYVICDQCGHTEEAKSKAGRAYLRIRLSYVDSKGKERVLKGDFCRIGCLINKLGAKPA